MIKNEVNLAVKGKIKGSKDVVFITVSLLLSVASLCFFTGPAYTKVLAAQKENAGKEKDLQSKQELLENIRDFNRKNKDANVDSKKLTTLISNRNNYEDYFFHLKELAKQSNLEIVSMDLQSGNGVASSSPAAAPAADEAGADLAMTGAGEENSGPKLQEQNINLSVRGTFENTSYFYKALENGIPFVQEISADLSYGEKTGEGGVPADNQEQNLNPVLESRISLKFNYY